MRSVWLLALAASGCRAILGIGDPPALGDGGFVSCEGWHPEGFDPCALTITTDKLALGGAAYTYDTSGGGSFQAAGGGGGQGGIDAVAGGAAGAVAAIAILHGGCPGGSSGAAGSVARPPASAGSRALGGAGGGAIRLVAHDAIDVAGAV